MLQSHYRNLHSLRTIFYIEEVVQEYREFLSWLLDLDTELINVAAEGEEMKNGATSSCKEHF